MHESNTLYHIQFKSRIKQPMLAASWPCLHTRSGHSWHTEIRSRPESCAVDSTKTSQSIAAGQKCDRFEQRTATTYTSYTRPYHHYRARTKAWTKRIINENLTSLSNVTQNQSSIPLKRRIETTKPGNSRNRWKNRCHNSTKGGIQKKLSFSRVTGITFDKIEVEMCGESSRWRVEWLKRHSMQPRARRVSNGAAVDDDAFRQMSSSLKFRQGTYEEPAKGK
jgi:hypothetical protein